MKKVEHFSIKIKCLEELWQNVMKSVTDKKIVRKQ